MGGERKEFASSLQVLKKNNHDEVWSLDQISQDATLDVAPGKTANKKNQVTTTRKQRLWGQDFAIADMEKSAKTIIQNKKAIEICFFFKEET